MWGGGLYIGFRLVHIHVQSTYVTIQHHYVVSISLFNVKNSYMMQG